MIPEKVAVVGSRRGSDTSAVIRFVRALHAKQPDTILISGGATGADKTAETIWLELGGHVWSYRVREVNPERYMVEKWDLGDVEPKVTLLSDHPTFADKVSALFYRNMLIAEADRVVAFFRSGKSGGAGTTIDFGKAYGRQTYEFEAAA